MFLDASAIVAMLTDEPDGERLAGILAVAKAPITSAIAIYETVARLMRKSSLSGEEARAVVNDFLRTAQVRIAPIGAAEAEAALIAFERYGKRRHPADLNMGDCFAYACAKTNGVKLLYIGNDFSKTDLG